MTVTIYEQPAHLNRAEHSQHLYSIPDRSSGSRSTQSLASSLNMNNIEIYPSKLQKMSRPQAKN